jgi:hypothetical protein
VHARPGGLATVTLILVATAASKPLRVVDPRRPAIDAPARGTTNLQISESPLAVLVATGVSSCGRRKVLGCAVGDSGTPPFSAELLRGLRDRGLSGVPLVVSDAHCALSNANAIVLKGTA